MLNLYSTYEKFQKVNDGKKMSIIEGYLKTALKSENPADWVLLFLQIAQKDRSPCVKHEAAFNTGQIFAKHEFNEKLEDIKDHIAHEFCKIVENNESMVMKHETLESIGDAGFDTPEVRELLHKYSGDKDADIANTAQISYWQITGEGFD